MTPLGRPQRPVLRVEDGRLSAADLVAWIEAQRLSAAELEGLGARRGAMSWIATGRLAVLAELRQDIGFDDHDMA
jgi:hypothetical protein